MRQSNNSWIEDRRLIRNAGQDHIYHRTSHTKDHQEDYKKERICGQEGVIFHVMTLSPERHFVDGEPVRFGSAALCFGAGTEVAISSAPFSKRAWRSFSVLLSRRLFSVWIMARAKRFVLSALVSDLVPFGPKRSCDEVLSVMNCRPLFRLLGRKGRACTRPLFFISTRGASTSVVTSRRRILMLPEDYRRRYCLT